MLIAAAFFLRGKFLGVSEFAADFVPNSLAYCCPSCGEIWGRVDCAAELRTEPYWQFVYAACEKHPVRGAAEVGYTPGCFTQKYAFSKTWLAVPQWGKAVEHLPEAVLRREFQLTLQEYDQNVGTGQD